MADQTHAIDQTVLDTKTDETGTVLAYEKGWYTIVLESGEETKRRGKDLEAVEDEETTGGTMAKKLSHYARGYVKTTNISGQTTRICGDQLSQELLSMDLVATYNFAASILGQTENDLRARYGHLNIGQQRMNLGNRIRGALRRIEEAGEDVTRYLDTALKSWRSEKATKAA